MPRLRQAGAAEPGLEPFEPGDPGRFVFPDRWGGALRRRPASAVGTVCEVEIPSRLHASVLDMNRFDVGRPGGGGIGFAVALFCRARVEVIPNRHVQAGGNRPAIALHFGRLFQAVTGAPVGLDIEVADHRHRHMGLGSSIGTLTAVAVGLNEVLGRPFSLRDLRKLIAYNYCEEVPGERARLVAGFETNVGAMAGIHGGMILASDGCELVFRVPLPEETRALLLLPHTGPDVTSGSREATALLTGARALDRRDAHRKAYRVLMDLLPAMARGDLEAVGDVILALAEMGSKRAECELHGTRGQEVYRLIRELRAQGAEVASMSSVGPAVFALSRRPETWERWRAWKEPGAVERAAVVPVDNTGARVRLDGVPIPYRFEPWWSEPQTWPPCGAR